MKKTLNEQGTGVREEIYNFLIKYMTENGYAPTVREIGEAVGLKSTSSVYNHLQVLEVLGKIKMGNGYKPRAIQLIGYELKKVKWKYMNHNYALTDFKIIKESDTDIYEQIVSVDLSNVMELPMVLVHRLENKINHMIAAYEEENGIYIPLDNMELGMHMDIDTMYIPTV